MARHRATIVMALMFAGTLAQGPAVRPANAATQSITYAYDAMGRLTRATYDDSLSTLYVYDARSNPVAIVTITGITDVDDDPATSPEVPRVFALARSVPNPMRTTTTFRYQLPESTPVRLSVFNAAGQRVRTLVERNQPAGYHAAAWDGLTDAGLPIPGGVYWYRLEARAFVKTRKLIVVH